MQRNLLHVVIFMISICLLNPCCDCAGGVAFAETSSEFELPKDMIKDLIVSKLPQKYEDITPESETLFTLNLRWLSGTCSIEIGQEDQNRTKVIIRCPHSIWTDTDSKTKRREERIMTTLTQIVSQTRLSMRMQQQENARAQELEDKRNQQMKSMIQEVVAASKVHKETSKSSSVHSDIDQVNFAESQRIMGDNDLAIIIGIEGYQSLPKSDYSYDDAKLVKEYAKALGFKERNIELLIDEKATRTNIEKSLEAWLKNKVKPQSRVFVYFSGHGAPDPSTGEAYLVPYDGDPNYLSITGYSLKRLYSTLGKLSAREVTVVLDACFSGTGGRSVLAKGARPMVMMTESLSLSSNMAVLSATQGSQISTSSPDTGHGIFTYYFLKALKEGNKNLGEIYGYMKPLVEDDAKALNVQQSPSLNPVPEKLVGRFSLRR